MNFKFLKVVNFTLTNCFVKTFKYKKTQIYGASEKVYKDLNFQVNNFKIFGYREKLYENLQFENF